MKDRPRKNKLKFGSRPGAAPGPLPPRPPRRTWRRAVLAISALVLAALAVALLRGWWSSSPGPAGTRADSSVQEGTSEPKTRERSGASETSGSGQAGARRSQNRDGAEILRQANEKLARGDLQGALRLYAEGLTVAPNDEDLHYNMGIAYARAGDTAQAEKHYREALRLLPNYPEVHNNLGNLLLHLGRLAEAEQEFVEAIKLMPEYARAHNNLGTLRQRQQRMADALACFQKAVQFDTNYWEAHFNLATAWVVQGNNEKAIAEFKETLRINPGYETAQRLLAEAMGQSPPYAPVPPGPANALPGGVQSPGNP